MEPSKTECETRHLHFVNDGILPFLKKWILPFAGILTGIGLTAAGWVICTLFGVSSDLGYIRGRVDTLVDRKEPCAQRTSADSPYARLDANKR